MEGTDWRIVQPPPSWHNISVIEPWLVTQLMSISGKLPISTTRDLFDQGFDRQVAYIRNFVSSIHSCVLSLHAAFLRGRIVSCLRSSTDRDVQQSAIRISQNFVYDHPTLRVLATAIRRITASKTEPNESDPTDMIKAMMRMYTSHLPKPICSDSARDRDTRPVTVLLTGSTGNVGCHVLASLLADTRVHRVYTLNRRSSSSSEGRQTSAFSARGLPLRLLGQGNLVQLVGDVTHDAFGLDQVVFEEVSALS
jgi:hypothetical protein